MIHDSMRRALQVLAFVLLGGSPAGAQSFGSLFTTLPADFAHLFTPSTAIVLGVGGGISAAVHTKDDEIVSRIRTASGFRATVFKSGQWLGDAPEQGAFAVAVYVIGRASDNSRLTAMGADLIDAQIVNGVLTQGLKRSINRTRPNGSPYSFPSGHASATFATATVIQQHYGWRAASPIYALASYVGVSRMVNGKHYLSDVIFGAALGIASGHAAAFGHGRGRVAVSPALLPGGVIVVGTLGP